MAKVTIVRVDRFERVYAYQGRFFIARKAERAIGYNPPRLFTVWEVAEATADETPIAPFTGEATRLADVQFDIIDRVTREKA